jgi:hypothetical protein
MKKQRMCIRNHKRGVKTAEKHGEIERKQRKVKYCLEHLLPWWEEKVETTTTR